MLFMLVLPIMPAAAIYAPARRLLPDLLSGPRPKKVKRPAPLDQRCRYWNVSYRRFKCRTVGFAFPLALGMYFVENIFKLGLKLI